VYPSPLEAELDLVGTPVDVGLHMREPGLAKDEVVTVEVVNNGVEVVKVVVAGKGDGGSVVGDGG